MQWHTIRRFNRYKALALGFGFGILDLRHVEEAVGLENIVTRLAITLHEDFDGVCRHGNVPISIGIRRWTTATNPLLFPVADEGSVACLDVTSFGNQDDFDFGDPISPLETTIVFLLCCLLLHSSNAKICSVHLVQPRSFQLHVFH